ncbi:unnamed protein product [Miscanthus lutarioriparius]|uniref:NAD-dependent epimerase/dehydratase domain-containing protein n=1 Tax=Miscanthus lutarioriparius TaxID=422564 RepID=A0A811RD14_9POAL|nr:unnamed protein product [Miscanthus lutarioriparius]
MEYFDARQKPHNVGKIIAALVLTTLCIFVLKQSHGFGGNSVFSRHELGVTHVLVTGGAGYIGSHAALRLLKDNYRVTIVDNLSRGNMGAVKVNKIFAENAFDVVMYFAAVAYVGESTLEHLSFSVRTNHFPDPTLIESHEFTLLLSRPFVTEKRQSVANRIREKYLDRILVNFYPPGGFFVYDIFWVFFTPFMVSVAKSFDAPIKLLFPTADAARAFSMLA